MTKESLRKISIEAQYIKDLSFENPNAPQSFKIKKPQINVSLDLHIQKIKETKEDIFEVCLDIGIKAINNNNIDNKVIKMFELELLYAGIFTLSQFD